jgi:DNA-binding NarL/FixJ family response regulator
LIRVAVVDDQDLVRAGFVLLLRSADGIEVVGEASDGLEAIEQAREHSPDVVLMDIRMPGLDGLEATRRLLAAGPGAPRVVVLTTFDLDEYVYEAMRAGASGFLLKSARPQQLVDAVRAVVAGDALLAPEITHRLLAEFLRRPPPGAALRLGLDDLTKRELEVLELIAAGLSNAEIAARLIVGEETVKTHVSRVFLKLGLRDRVQAVIAAYETGLVRPGSD